MYNEFLTQNALDSSYNYFYKTVDRGLVEKIGPFGLVNEIKMGAANIKKFQSGFVLDYLTYFLISLSFIFIFF
jgi:hypothetical protein